MAANHFSCMIKWDREMPLVTQDQIIEAFNLPAGGGILSVVIRRTTAYVRYQNDVAGYIAAAGVVQQNPTILGRATRVCKVHRRMWEYLTVRFVACPGTLSPTVLSIRMPDLPITLTLIRSS